MNQQTSKFNVEEDDKNKGFVQKLSLMPLKTTAKIFGNILRFQRFFILLPHLLYGEAFGFLFYSAFITLLQTGPNGKQKTLSLYSQ